MGDDITTTDDRRQQYFSERKMLVDARQRVQQRTDQLVTGGAAGALVLSITFLDTIAPTPALSSRWFLIGAWGCLLLALLASLIGSFASQWAFDQAIAAYDRAFDGDEDYAPRRSAYWITKALTYTGAAAFVAGVILLASFAFVNAPFGS